MFLKYDFNLKLNFLRTTVLNSSVQKTTDLDDG
jgi:hypothetical protein